MAELWKCLLLGGSALETVGGSEGVSEAEKTPKQTHPIQ